MSTSYAIDINSTPTLTDVRRMFDELQLAIDFKANKSASKLCSSCAVLIVKLFDINSNSDTKPTQLEAQTIDIILKQLRLLSLLLDAYDDIEQFVSLQDLMVAKSLNFQLDNTTKVNKSMPTADKCVQVFMRALFLLRLASTANNNNYRAVDQFWFDKQALVEELENANVTELVLLDADNSQTILRKSADSSKQQSFCGVNAALFLNLDDANLEHVNNNDDDLEQFLKAQWFRKFALTHLSTLAGDLLGREKRAVILTALLIVAQRAQHAKLAALVDESLRQLLGDDRCGVSSSICDSVDALGFSRAGELWLAAKQSSLDELLLARVDESTADYEDDDDDDHDDDDDDNDDFYDRNSEFKDEQMIAESTIEDTSKNLKDFESQVADLTNLRRKIDAELDGKLACFACGLAFASNSESRARVITASQCKKCAQQVYTCAETFERLPLADVANAFACRQSNHIVICSELIFARSMLSTLSIAETKLLPNNDDDNTDDESDDENMVTNDNYENTHENDKLNKSKRKTKIGEQFSSSTKFEKLTLARKLTLSSSSSSSLASSIDSNSESEDLSSSSFNLSNNLQLTTSDEQVQSSSTQVVENNINNTNQLTVIRQSVDKLLNEYWKFRAASKARNAFLFKKFFLSINLLPSESFRLLNFAKKINAPIIVLSNELTISDSILLKQRPFVELKFLVSSNVCLLACNQRSTISQLPLGCGRLFIRSVNKPKTCSHCTLTLRDLTDKLVLANTST